MNIYIMEWGHNEEKDCYIRGIILKTSKTETTDFMLSSLHDSDLIILNDQVIQELAARNIEEEWERVYTTPLATNLMNAMAMNYKS